MQLRVRWLAFSGLLALAVVTPAQVVNLIQNGSFELDSPGEYPGGTSAQHWETTFLGTDGSGQPGKIAVVRTSGFQASPFYRPTPAGSNVLEMRYSFATSVVRQRVSLSGSATHSLSFLLGTLAPEYPEYGGRVRVRIFDTSNVALFTEEFTRAPNAGYGLQSFTPFRVASSGDYFVTFDTLDNAPAQVGVIDDVVLTSQADPVIDPVPEPMTLALAAAGLGAAVRRRRARRG